MEEVAGKLKLSKVPEKPWTYLMVDFITKLPVVAGKDAILVVCDRLFKMTHFVTTCCGNHLSQRQMITQAVNLLVGYQVGNSQENSTRSLC